MLSDCRSVLNMVLFRLASLTCRNACLATSWRPVGRHLSLKGFEGLPLNPERLFVTSLCAGIAAWLLNVLGCGEPPEHLRSRRALHCGDGANFPGFSVFALSQHEVTPPGAVTDGRGVSLAGAPGVSVCALISVSCLHLAPPGMVTHDELGAP